METNIKIITTVITKEQRNTKIRMAFLQSAFVTIAEAGNKERQSEGGMLGLYDRLPHGTAVRGWTVPCCLQHKPFTPGKDWKSQYEVMECTLRGFG